MSLFLDVYLCAVLICSLGLLSIFLFTLVLICQYFYRRHRLKCKTTCFPQSNCRFIALCFPLLYLKQTVKSNVCLYCFFLYSQLPSGQMSRKQVLVCSLFRNQKAGGGGDDKHSICQLYICKTNKHYVELLKYF